MLRTKTCVITGIRVLLKNQHLLTRFQTTNSAIQYPYVGDGVAETSETSTANVTGIVDDVGPQTSHPILTRCLGCGVALQSLDADDVGYVPNSVVLKYSDGRLKKFPRKFLPMNKAVPAGVIQDVDKTCASPKLQILICQRCFQLQNYKSYKKPHLGEDSSSATERLNAPVFDEKSVRTPSRSLTLGDTTEIQHPVDLIEKIVVAIRPGSLVVHIVDITDFENTMVPELHEACRRKHLDTLWVVNKLDCLPPESREVNKLLKWIRRYSSQMKESVLGDIVFVSAMTGFNFGLLEKKIYEHTMENSQKSRYIYFVGRVNVGKSTLVNRFLRIIGYKHLGQSSGNACGITESAMPGTTLDFIPFSLPKKYKLIDSPGIPSNHDMASSLTKDCDIQRLVHQATIKPAVFRLRTGTSLLIGGLARLDYIDSQHPVVLACYFTKHVTLQLCPTAVATEVINKKIGKQLCPPSGDDVALPLFRKHHIRLFAKEEMDNISISGLGWISLQGHQEEKSFNVWVPDGVHVFRRPGLPIELPLKHKKIRSTAARVDKARRHRMRTWSKSKMEKA